MNIFKSCLHFVKLQIENYSIIYLFLEVLISIICLIIDFSIQISSFILCFIHLGKIYFINHIITNNSCIYKINYNYIYSN